MKRTFLLLLSFTLLLGLQRPVTAAGTETSVVPPATAADTFSKGVNSVQLDNGMTVLLKEDHSLPVVSVQVWVKTGSVNENSKTSGLSHFLEHLIFKGTEKYPGDEISRQVETQGGVINAATSKEFTHFYIDIQETGYRNAVRILADAMANAAFPPAEIERERPVVIEEIHRHEDNPGSLLYDYYNEAVFPHSPYRASVIGSDAVIRSVSRDDIAAYYHAHYVPANMFVAIAGDIRTDEALALVKETFGKQKALTPPEEPNLIEPLHTVETLSRNRDVEHAYWLGGFIGPDVKSDEQFAADVAATILGGGRSSRLFRSLREEKQLVYSISSSFWSQRGSGAVAVSAIFEPKNEKKVLSEIDAEIRRLQEKGPSDAELRRAKELIKAQWFFGLETCHDQASSAGYWNMQGNPGLLARYIPELEKVSKDDVTRFLKKYYDAQGMSGAMLLPKK